MKKIIFSILLIIPIFLFADNVNAVSINELPSFSDRYYYDTTSGQYKYESNSSTSYGSGFGVSSYLNSYPYFSMSGTNITIWTNSGLQWSNKDWCDNSSILFTGFLVPQQQESSRYLFQNVNSFTLSLQIPQENHTSLCTTTAVQLSTDVGVTYAYQFSCSAPKSQNSVRSFKFLLSAKNGFAGGGYWGIMNTNFSYSCDISTSDIINSQTQNSQNIINNQNQNTQDIINNQNGQAENIMNNDNRNQAQTNEKLDNLNDSITSTESPDMDNAFSDIDLDTDSAISDLLLLPINFLQRVLNLSSNTCSNYSIDFGIFGSDYKLNFPCIKINEFLGDSLWTTIDYLICFFMIYNIVMLIIKAFEDLTSLRDTYDSLYQPKHADMGYKPKHGGD